jgi:DNA-binding NarL/FixJ family response regulator
MASSINHQFERAALSSLTALNPQREGILLDDHPLWLEALTRLCQSVGLDVVGSCTTSQEALGLLGQRTADILITDLRLGPSGTAIGFIREARKRVPGLRVLVISGFDDPASVEEALAAGADAFISKTAAADDLAAAVRQVFNQSLFIGPGFRESASYSGTNGKGRGAELTKREKEIMDLVAQGYSNTRVASLLWVTEQTVKFHLSNIYRKLGVANRTEATRWWVEHADEFAETQP